VIVGLALVAGCQVPTAPPSTSPPVVPATQEQALLTRVVDGDTVVTGDGRTVRVLGIDACDLGTPAGDRARDEAVALLASAGAEPVVVLRGEPGVDRTPDGLLLLRHVEVRGSDWGRQAVPYEHTGAVLVGGGATAYVDGLRALDTTRSTSNPPIARSCDGPPAATTTTTTSTTTTTEETATDDGDPNRRYRPDGTADDDSDGGSSSTGRGSGGSGSSSGDGHPCGPGERDGDGDGLCGES
jgi:uncharacterized membrane protein YgcG